MTEKRKVIVDDEEFEVELEKKGTSWQVRIKDKEFLIKVEGERNKISKENKRKKKVRVGKWDGIIKHTWENNLTECWRW